MLVEMEREGFHVLVKDVVPEMEKKAIADKVRVCWRCVRLPAMRL